MRCICSGDYVSCFSWDGGVEARGENSELLFSLLAGLFGLDI